VNPWPDLGIDGEPELLFQPAVDLATGRLIGFEALLRLRRTVPIPGYILPNQLIPSAEARGPLTVIDLGYSPLRARGAPGQCDGDTL
jgi:EAL domain-containing protein (putative c-di-GMP-specific phosphodiesterase class I)